MPHRCARLIRLYPRRFDHSGPARYFELQVIAECFRCGANRRQAAAAIHALPTDTAIEKSRIDQIAAIR
jgi:hypothetical protein